MEDYPKKVTQKTDSKLSLVEQLLQQKELRGKARERKSKSVERFHELELERKKR